MLSRWIRTSSAPGLKRDHKGNTSGTTLDFLIQKHRLPVSISATDFSFFLKGHFLSVVPSGGNRTTADLISPVFLPSQTCQVTKPLLLEFGERRRHRLTTTLLTFFALQLSFHHYVGAKHGRLQVFVQDNVQGEMTEVWKNPTQSLTGTWSQTVILLSSNHSFQVCNI